MTKVLFVIPPGLDEMASQSDALRSHHEATSGMGALAKPPDRGTKPHDSGVPGPRPFLYPPHTVATCAAVARAAGLDVAALDLTFGQGSGEVGVLKNGRAGEWITDAIGAASNADVLAVLVSHGTAYADENFLRQLHSALRNSQSPIPNPQPKILLFGPSAHLVAGPWLAEGLADALLTGEPEFAIADAIERLAAAEPGLPPGLGGWGGRAAGEPELPPDWGGWGGRAAAEPGLPPGLGGRGGRAAAEPGRPPALGGMGGREPELPPDLGGRGGRADLDALPFPAWDLVPWQAYGAVSLLSSRGCPAGCSYCAYTVTQGRVFRSQSPERTVAELVWLAETFHPPRIQVRDPVFAHDRARVVAICEGVMSQTPDRGAKGLRLNFACESRPEHFDDELLRLLQAAGCTMVKIGLESGDPALLCRLGRATDLAAAEHSIFEAGRVARTCARLGLACQLFVMAGLPGQDVASLTRTEAFLRRLPPQTMIRAKRYEAHPGTLLTEPGGPVPAETLMRWENANRPRPALWTRVAKVIRRVAAHASIDATADENVAGSKPRSAVGGVAYEWREDGTPPCSVPDYEPIFRTIFPAGTRAFLTGGNGFVGGHVARALVEAGLQVVALVRPGSPLGMLEGLPVEIVRGDLAQPSGWAAALHGCELCFHVAALYAGADQVEAMYAVNAGGTSALLAACKAAGVRRAVYTGTIGTVGRPVGTTALRVALPDETTPFNLWDQSSHYVKSKYLGELIALSWSGVGLEVVIVKPTAPVGAGDARPSATGRRILAALRGEVTPYPPGGVNHVPVRDVAAGHLLAAQLGVSGRTYILGHKEGNLDHAGFLRMVAEAAGEMSSLGKRKSLRPPKHPVPAAGLPEALTADPSRAIRELGMPQSDLRAAFKEAVEWFATFG